MLSLQWTPMTEKRRLPTELYRELSEYASLLRALRARDTLDLTKSLVNPSPFALDNDNDVEVSPCPGPSDLSHPSNSPSPSTGSRTKGKQKEVSEPPEYTRREHWTRWPLPLKDVLLPEWTLQDEVAVIASQAVKSRQPFVFPVLNASPHKHDAESDVECDDDGDRLIHVMDMEIELDDPDPPFYVPYLTSIVSKYLATIFSNLASHTPARPASMQNRIEPLNWRSVIDVVASCGIPEFANPKIIESVIKRMEAIYGPSILPVEDSKSTSFRAVDRIKHQQATTEMFEKMMQDAKNNIFIQDSPSPDRNQFVGLISTKKKSKLTLKEEAAFKARKTSKPYDGTPRKRGNPNKKRPRPESTSGEVVPTDVGESGTILPTKRSKRTKKDPNYLHDPFLQV